MTCNQLISLGQRVSSKFRRTPGFSFILGAIDTDAATTSQNQESDHSQQDEDTSEGEEKMDQEEKDYWQDVQMEVDGWRERVRQDDTLQEPAQDVAQNVAEEVAQEVVQDEVQNVAHGENQEKEMAQENGIELENIGARSRSRGGTRGKGSRAAARSGTRSGTRSKKGASRGV